MRGIRIVFLGIILSLAALLFGVVQAGATHGNATYDCYNNDVVLNVTILGSTTWGGFNTAVYTVQDHPEVEPVSVTRGSDGVMPNASITIPEGAVILGRYDGPQDHARDLPVPYTVTGEKPDCSKVPEETTTTTGTTVPGETTTTVTGQTTTTHHNQTTTSTGTQTLPATGCGWVLPLVGALILLLGSAIGAYLRWNTDHQTTKE